MDTHTYTLDIDEIGAFAFAARKFLDSYGLNDTEIILGEYNIAKDIDDVSSYRCAAALSGALCLMQKSPLSKAMYYDAQTNSTYCGLFKREGRYGLEKPYYSLIAFNELYKIKDEV